jgi:predicted PurR-regulated permease PerM
MEIEKYTEKLAKYTLYAAVFCLIAALCWYLKDVLVYILAAVVISLMARPITTVLRKIKIRGKRMPDWLSALIALLLLIGGILAIVTMIIPIIGSIAKGISMASIEKAAAQVSVPLANLNEFLRTSFPALGQDFKIETSIFNELHNLLDVSIFSSVLGSAASIISSVGVGLFSVVFISFFFTKDESLFGKMIGSLVPDRHEENATAAISDIGQLLSRYFSGVVVEMIGVGLLNFLGLFFITRLGFNAAIGIAFLTGILNIIPYVGPLFGGILGTMLAIIVKYSSVTPIGLNIGFGWFVLILIAIFCFTQLVDNILYQPIIYSSSIKAKPLEIFIVLLIAGHLAGPLGMIIAIPGYTVIRVIAFRFFPDIKAIKRLEKQ